MKYTLIFICVILVAAILAGCATNPYKGDDANTSNISNTETQTNANTQDKSLKDNISTYCEKYLSFGNNNPKNIENIKDISSDDYYNDLQTIEKYIVEDDDYYQSTSIKEIFYGTQNKYVTKITIAALCNQSLTYNNETTTYSLFYIFDLIFDDGKGWVINGVTKSDL